MAHMATEVDFARAQAALTHTGGGRRTRPAPCVSPTRRARAPRLRTVTLACGAVAGARRARGPAGHGWASSPRPSAARAATSSRCTWSGEPADDGSVTDELLVRVPSASRPGRARRRDRARGHPVHAAGARGRGASWPTRRPRRSRWPAWSSPNPGSAPRAVATMLRARLVDPAAEAPPGTSTRCGSATAQVRLGRAWPFTATELSRAAALLELAAQLAMRVPAEPRGRADPAAARRLGGAGARARPPRTPCWWGRCTRAAHRRRAASRFLSPTPRLGPGELERAAGRG